MSENYYSEENCNIFVQAFVIIILLLLLFSVSYLSVLKTKEYYNLKCKVDYEFDQIIT